MGDSKDKKEKKKDKKEKKEKKKEKKAKDDSDDDEDDEEKKAKKKEKKEKKEKKDKKEKKEKKEKKKDKKKKEKDDSDSDKDSGGDKDDDADDSRRGSKAAEGDDLNFTDEVIKESIARVRKLIQEAEGKPMGTEKFFDETRMIQIQNSFSYKLRLNVVLEGCFGEDLAPAKLKPKMPYIKKMVSTPPMAIKDILYAFEVYYVENPKNRKQYPMCLKELYEADLVQEADLQKHYSSSLDTEGFADAKAAAKPFLEWLAQEDSESESGSEEGSDVDVD